MIIMLFAFTGTSVQAEVFTCKQADGTTVFSHVPCREDKPRPLVTVPLFVETEIEIRDYPAEIAAIETELDGLRKARETEIANAPYSAQNPDSLYELKTAIRANYQTQIDEKLSQLVSLRARQQAEVTGE